MLSRAGVKRPIVTIDGGEEGIVYLRACLTPGAAGLRPALIFCDVKMPMQDGFEVLKWAQQHAALREIPFYILSGGDLEADRSRARDLGATSYLVKFPAGERLKEILQQARVL
jgi:CheY-like chemotaxis protein